MDGLLATPQPHVRLLLEKIGALLIAFILIAVLFTLGTIAGEASLGGHIDFVRALLLLASVLTWLALLIGAQLVNLSVDQGKVIAASFSMLPPALITVGLVYALAGRLRYGAALGHPDRLSRPGFLRGEESFS